MTMLWLLLPMLFGLLYAETRNHRRLSRLVPDHPQPLHRGLSLLPDILLLIALSLILLALQPSTATIFSNAPEPAIALVVDVSASMAVTDQQPDRLTRAKHELLALIDKLPHARFSLIPFAGEPVVQVPLTGDHAGLKFFINSLHTGLISSLGSAPEEAVRLAQKSLTQVAGERLIILISDGERTIAEAPPELTDAIPVYCVMTGTTDGGPVGKLQAAISRADPGRLAVIANQTGGRVLNGNLLTPAVFDLPLVKRWIETVDPPPTHIALVVALLLLLLRSAPATVSFKRIFPVALSLWILLMPGCEHNTKSQPWTQFENGLQAANNNDTDSALAAFATAAKELDGKQRGIALYNQGTLLLETGQADAAVVMFEQALLLLPGDAASIDNLLLALIQQAAISSDGKGKPEQVATGAGEELSPEQARRLIDSVHLDPAAPLTEATVRQPTVLKEW